MRCAPPRPIAALAHRAGLQAPQPSPAGGTRARGLWDRAAPCKPSSSAPGAAELRDEAAGPGCSLSPSEDGGVGVGVARCVGAARFPDRGSEALGRGFDTNAFMPGSKLILWALMPGFEEIRADFLDRDCR